MKLYKNFNTIRDDECHFIIGEPAGSVTLYCGDPALDRCKPYCAKHAKIMFVAAKDDLEQEYLSKGV
jgi:hypothetical protein